MSAIDFTDASAKRPPRSQRRLPVDVSIILSIVTLVGVATISLSAWAFAGDNTKAPASEGAKKCTLLSDDAARLACYDKAEGRVPTPPAKGALAPAQ